MPDAHVFAFRIIEMSDRDAHLPISIVGESSLFDGTIDPSWNKYALQMALKLLVAQIVMTEHYITLDADVVVVGSLDTKQLLPDGKATQAHCALF